MDFLLSRRPLFQGEIQGAPIYIKAQPPTPKYLGFSTPNQVFFNMKSTMAQAP